MCVFGNFLAFVLVAVYTVKTRTFCVQKKNCLGLYKIVRCHLKIYFDPHPAQGVK